jgi:hypothetical protein
VKDNKKFGFGINFGGNYKACIPGGDGLTFMEIWPSDSEIKRNLRNRL